MCLNTRNVKCLIHRLLSADRHTLPSNRCEHSVCFSNFQTFPVCYDFVGRQSHTHITRTWLVSYVRSRTCDCSHPCVYKRLCQVNVSFCQRICLFVDRWLADSLGCIEPIKAIRAQRLHLQLCVCFHQASHWESLHPSEMRCTVLCWWQNLFGQWWKINLVYCH